MRAFIVAAVLLGGCTAILGVGDISVDDDTSVDDGGPHGNDGALACDLTSLNAPTCTPSLLHFMPGNASVEAVTGTFVGRAFVAANGQGVSFIDISDPSNPSRTGGYAVSPTTAQGMVTNADATMLYVADVGGTVQLIDTSNPAGGAYVSYVSDLPEVALSLQLSAERNLLWVLDMNGEMNVVDVSFPPAPYTWTEFVLADPVHAFSLLGDHLYLVSPSGLQIVDVTDPSRPQALGRYDLDHGVSVALHSTSTAYVGTTSGDINVIDVSNPYEPHCLALVRVPGASSIKHLAVDSSVTRLHVAGGGGGGGGDDLEYWTFSLADPYHPTLAGQYGTDAGASTGIAFTGIAGDVVLVGYSDDANSVGHGVRILDVGGCQ